MEDVMVHDRLHAKSENFEEKTPAVKVEPDSELGLSHQEALSVVQTILTDVLSHDPLLSDLPSCVTLEEVNSQIALEYGQAMTVNVCKADGEVLPVVVEQKATVLDLKKAIGRHVNLKQSREGRKTKLNWRYVWRTYWLYFNGQKLMEDKKPIKEYGIRNKAEITFIKRLRDKQAL